MTNRRSFLQTGLVAGAATAAGLISKTASAASQPAPEAPMIPLGGHTLPKLEYGYTDLEPYIDADTLQIHHQKHHQGYVNGLNKTEIALEKARKNKDFSAIKDLEIALAFHGSGHVHHSIYWDNMKPKAHAKSKPEGRLATQITKDFGSFDAFKAQFSAASKSVEGNGWGVLSWHPGLHRLYVAAMLNHQNMGISGGVPLLVCDVWEHAYYLKYQNKRGDYIGNWWNLVDWANVEKRLENLL